MAVSNDISPRCSSEATELVKALEKAKAEGKKSLIRSTDHIVILESASAGPSSNDRSALIEEIDDEGVEKTAQEIDCAGRDLHSYERITLTSWKTQEFAYRKTTSIGFRDAVDLPTLARGLFTTSDHRGGSRIVVRGYDKFFNEGEMPWTKAEAIAAFSTPPYELTFKENGCIIFIAALSPHQLIVTSKHSLGANESHAISHAQKGEEWLQKHLHSVGKKRADLAKTLWDRNETAVAELCDDTFEEHVLAYSEERSGLHLHGLNANTVRFQTRSSREVEEFAKEWGLLPTRYFAVDSLEEVKKLTQSVGETGSWQGNAIEGFVVRTRMPGRQDVCSLETTKGDVSSHLIAPPYAESQTWFYKVKYEEPYLMYRDWRELTRRMMTDKANYEKSSATGALKPDLPKVKNKRAETMLFIEWCYERLYGSEDGRVLAQPDLFATLHLNRGIIKMRHAFLDYMASEEGEKRIQKWQSKSAPQQNDNKKAFTKTLIIPIAIPGCGKTALGVALTHIYKEIGHTQSDDVQTKKTGPTFLRNVIKELDTHDIVFADRNNHLCKHREEIVKAAKEWEQMPAKAMLKTKLRRNGKTNGVKEMGKDDVASMEARFVRLVAIVWPIEDLPLNAVHHLCSDRLLSRGDNHQSLRADTGREYEHVLWQFLQTRQAFQQGGNCDDGDCDARFDEVISLDINSNLSDMVQTTAKALAGILNLSIPTPKEVDMAVKKAQEYQVSIKKEIKGVAIPTIRYFGLSVEADLTKEVQAIVADDVKAKQAFDKLIKEGRVIARPHVTLVHISEMKAVESEAPETPEQKICKQRWEHYSSCYEQSQSPILYEMMIDCLAWDDRAMSLGIAEVTSGDQADLKTLQGSQWRPHITVGTFSDDIRPYEGRRVLCDADVGSKTVACIRLKQPLHVTGRLQALH